MVIIGVSNSLFNSVLFACVPLVCELKIVATAFGALFTIYNAGLVIGPMIASYIIDNT